MGILDIIVAVLFVIAVIAVGLIKSTNEKTHSESGTTEYFLAGRGLSWWLIGFSLIAANISAEQFVGMSGQGAGFEGLSVASWEWIASITLVVVAFVLLPYFLRTGITTIPEFLEIRYNHWARLVMTISMTIILIGVSLIGVIYAGAITLTRLFAEYGYDVSIALACWVLGGMAAAYVAFGGLKACAWADLLQGAALILGGMIITYYALKALGIADVNDVVSATGAHVEIAQNASELSKFTALNGSTLHMNTPAMPWQVLLLGIWIPNFYYWSLNQYITQRVLGSASLGDGQKGLVFAAAIKLIIPFIIVIPGIIAFNLFSKDMESAAQEGMKNGETVFTEFETQRGNPESVTIFVLDSKYSNLNPDVAAEVEMHNKSVIENMAIDEQWGEIPSNDEVYGYMQIQIDEMGLKRKAISPYKYDTAMGLLITKLIPKNKGILGFVVAALIGAIVSSLAAVLNAASTLFTMDVYQRYIRPKASSFEAVTFGRICIIVFFVIGCLVAPMLSKFDSIFEFIQSFQGYVSTGILAVFIYGLINRTSGKWAGVIGIVSNAVFYQILLSTFPEMHFLYSMAYSLIAVLILLTIYGMIWKAPRVDFDSTTTLDMTSSKNALIAGIVVCVLTVCLYVIFW